MKARGKKKTERYGERRERGRCPVPSFQNSPLAPDSKSPGLTTSWCPGIKCYSTHRCILILVSPGNCKKPRRLSRVNFPPSFNLQVQFAKCDLPERGSGGRSNCKSQQRGGGEEREESSDHLCLKASDKKPR